MWVTLQRQKETGPGYQCEQRSRSAAELMSVSQPGEVDGLPVRLLWMFKYKGCSPQKSRCNETVSMTPSWPSSSQPISVRPIPEAATKLLPYGARQGTTSSYQAVTPSRRCPFQVAESLS